MAMFLFLLLKNRTVGGAPANRKRDIDEKLSPSVKIPWKIFSELIQKRADCPTSVRMGNFRWNIIQCSESSQGRTLHERTLPSRAIPINLDPL
jgi:hypothetical protein